MAHDLATVIDEARRQALVGRDVELAGFDDATAGRVSRRVLFVYGPGGIGKTALLQQIALQARACARTAIMIDGREVDCSPDGVRTALDRAVSKLEGARLRRRPSSARADRDRERHRPAVGGRNRRGAVRQGLSRARIEH